jgi:hypothetical protein
VRVRPGPSHSGGQDAGEDGDGKKSSWHPQAPPDTHPCLDSNTAQCTPRQRRPVARASDARGGPWPSMSFFACAPRRAACNAECRPGRRVRDDLGSGSFQWRRSEPPPHGIGAWRPHASHPTGNRHRQVGARPKEAGIATSPAARPQGRGGTEPVKATYSPASARCRPQSDVQSPRRVPRASGLRPAYLGSTVTRLGPAARAPLRCARCDAPERQGPWPCRSDLVRLADRDLGTAGP